jgi:hypothetical protein
MSEQSEQARRYRTFAEEARTYAIGAKPKHQASLMKLAEEYERMAREVEAVEATKDIFDQVVSSPDVAE